MRTAEITVTCPADGSEIGRVPVCDAAEVAGAAARLREAQPGWRDIGFAGRAAWMRRWRDWLLDNNARLTRLVQEETGKSLADASMEVPVALEVINYYAEHAEEFLAPVAERPHSLPMLGKRLQTTFAPYPLVGLITPWNGPIGNGMLDLPAAMMAGCAVLTKPSEETPLSWKEVVRGWLEDLGAPPILACVTGAGETGASVVDAVDMVHFTGSVRTGRAIAMRCAERLIPCSLELGGKDAMLVCADADLERAAAGAVWGGFTNSGQICISVERVYVVAPVYDEFVQLVTERARALRVGMESNGRVAFDYGAMATPTQRGIVEEHLNDALQKGARAVSGGQRVEGAGLFFEPTVLVDVTHDMTCMREETFGPTLPIMEVADVNEAIELANDSAYGLSASVWTRDRRKGEQLAEALNAGAVNINNVFINLFQLGLPMGGWGDSGIGGRLGGASGIRKYCREKAIVSERLPLKSEVHWYPATPRKLSLQARGIALLNGGDWRRRLGRRPKT